MQQLAADAASPKLSEEPKTAGSFSPPGALGQRGESVGYLLPLEAAAGQRRAGALPQKAKM